MTGVPAYTAFDGHRRIASGSLAEVERAVAAASAAGATGPVLVFDDATGRITDIDTRGTDGEIAGRHGGMIETASAQQGDLPANDGAETPDASRPRGPGRPKLGVVAREVTLLPRHWAWLAEQPGGASVALRRLVEEARKESAESDRERRAREAAYRVMHALGGDLPGFEEASRALFAGDRARLTEQMAAWPEDVASYVASYVAAQTSPRDVREP